VAADERLPIALGRIPSTPSFGLEDLLVNGHGRKSFRMGTPHHDENPVVHHLHFVHALIDRVVLLEGIAAAILDNVVILSADPRVVVTIIVALPSLEARQKVLELRLCQSLSL
jgi:hypothetical protein